jgi:hypothetical protein
MICSKWPLPKPKLYIQCAVFENHRINALATQTAGNLFCGVYRRGQSELMTIILARAANSTTFDQAPKASNR